MAAANTSRSGNPSKRAQSGEQGSSQGRLAVGISAMALAVSILAAGGTWAQVFVDRDAISEKLTIRADVRAYDQETSEYGPILEEGQRAPNPVPGKSRLYVLLYVTNIGKGSGVITDIGLRTGKTSSVSFPTANCEWADDGKDGTVACHVPISLGTAKTVEVYLLVNLERLDALGCSANDATIKVYVVDSTGQQIPLDTGILRPDSTPTCLDGDGAEN